MLRFKLILLCLFVTLRLTVGGLPGVLCIEPESRSVAIEAPGASCCKAPRHTSEAVLIAAAEPDDCCACLDLQVPDEDLINPKTLSAELAPAFILSPNPEVSPHDVIPPESLGSRSRHNRGPPPSAHRILRC